MALGSGFRSSFRRGGRPREQRCTDCAPGPKPPQNAEWRRSTPSRSLRYCKTNILFAEDFSAAPDSRTVSISIPVSFGGTEFDVGASSIALYRTFCAAQEQNRRIPRMSLIKTFHDDPRHKKITGPRLNSAANSTFDKLLEHDWTALDSSLMFAAPLRIPNIIHHGRPGPGESTKDSGSSSRIRI